MLDGGDGGWFQERHAPFRSVGGGTGGTRLGAWADFSRVAQSMGRSWIGDNDVGFFQRLEVPCRIIFVPQRGQMVGVYDRRGYW